MANELAFHEACLVVVVNPDDTTKVRRISDNTWTARNGATFSQCITTPVQDGTTGEYLADFWTGLDASRIYPLRVYASTATAFSDPASEAQWVPEGLSTQAKADVTAVVPTAGDTASEIWQSDIRTLTGGAAYVIQQPGWYNGTIVIRQGDSYGTTSGQRITIDKSTIAGASWPTDLTGWTITFTASLKQSAIDRGVTGTAALSKVCVHGTETGASQTFYVDLTAAETALLATGKDNDWTFAVDAVNGLLNNELVSGNMTVLA